jgi:hypothetical protein
VEDQTPASVACPGVVRNRDKSTLSRLPPSPDVFEIFAKLRNDNDLSDEEAFFKFITTYDVPIETLNRISGGLPYYREYFANGMQLHDFQRHSATLNTTR